MNATPAQDPPPRPMPSAPSDHIASIIDTNRAAGCPGRRVRRRHHDVHVSDAVTRVPPVVHGARRHLDERVSGTRDPFFPGQLKAHLAGADLSALD